MFTYDELDKILDCLVLLDTLYAMGDLDGSEYQKAIGSQADSLGSLVNRKMMIMKLEKEKDSDATNDTVQFGNTY